MLQRKNFEQAFFYKILNIWGFKNQQTIIKQNTFQAIYKCLISREKGPRLPGFLKEIGKWWTYHPNGNPRNVGNYNLGKKDGDWLQYYENGKIENSQNMPLGLLIRNAKKGKIEELKQTPTKAAEHPQDTVEHPTTAITHQ